MSYIAMRSTDVEGLPAEATNVYRYVLGHEFEYTYLYKLDGAWWYQTYEPDDPDPDDDGWVTHELSGVGNLQDAKAVVATIVRMNPILVR
jgi:hypothetical protein